MIPLATVTLAIGAVKAAFEFLCTEEGQRALADARENREKLAEWWVKNTGGLEGWLAKLK